MCLPTTNRLLITVLFLSIWFYCFYAFQESKSFANSVITSFRFHEIIVKRKSFGYHPLYGAKFPPNDEDFPVKKTTPRPKVISPKRGVHPELEKFMMMYTCKICQGRNAQMISKVAYQSGMVVSTCTHCKNKHLIADNQGKLDFPDFGRKIDEYLQARGEQVQKLSLTSKDLEDNYLVDQDGVINLIPKAAGQLSIDSTIVEYPEVPKKT